MIRSRIWEKLRTLFQRKPCEKHRYRWVHPLGLKAYRICEECWKIKEGRE